MVIHPHYMKRYVHDIRVGQLKGVSHNRYFVLSHGGSGGIKLLKYVVYSDFVSDALIQDHSTKP